MNVTFVPINHRVCSAKKCPEMQASEFKCKRMCCPGRETILDKRSSSLLRQDELVIIKGSKTAIHSSTQSCFLCQ